MRLRTTFVGGTVAIACLAAAGSAYANCASSNALGVSRTIAIDTTGGKLYGGLQYKANSMLREREVILTFDDGPLRRYTRQVLAALSAHCTKATFFMVGRMAVADPAMVREVEQAGHTIANHTWSHPNLFKRSASSAAGNIELGISAVQHAAKNPIAPFFRFPYLADPQSMLGYLQRRDFAIFSIDIDSYDYRTTRPERVYSTIMKQLRSRRKGIMLFHDIQRSTAGAMRRILDDMKREGYKIVHVVAKKPAKTLAAYDERAAELHRKRRTVATAAALQDGSLPTSTPRAKRRQSTRNRVAATTSASPPAAKPKTAAPAVRPRPVIRRPASDWRRQVWGN